MVAYALSANKSIKKVFVQFRSDNPNKWNWTRSKEKDIILKKYDPVQVGYLSEKCIAVDEHDNIIGGVTKGNAHNVATMSLHRAFSLFAFTPDKRLILQKRSAKKLSFQITFPCLWTNTCCSHPLFTANEQSGTAGVIAAVIRKVKHELGVVDLDPKKCYVMGRFLYKAVGADMVWGEQELDYAIVARNFEFDQLLPNPEEVSDIKAVDEQELAHWVATEYSSFSPWFQLFYRLRFLSEWWSNIDQIEHHPVDMNIVRMN
ncbi:isopentenyl-diphosphate delta-isomerase [Dictyocaulus viviparus]|uniref:isopentenyl-diphosphate Delta-isomerase n=1 Tax=Dictyocaulus viviparus TaxID=29172 RepID=A0A0D8XDT7_DICVI|nr:isopentenyl-diphosphate delta-isomerase [Dictyocaulus viviparus]